MSNPRTEPTDSQHEHVAALIKEHGVNDVMKAFYRALVEAIVSRDAGISKIDDRDYARARGLAVREMQEILTCE